MSVKAAEFIGFPGAEHIADSARPVAAIVSSMSGMQVPAVHNTLVVAGISDENGDTGPLHRMRLEGSRSAVLIEPVKLSRNMGIEGILERFDEQFIGGHAVALLHMTQDPSSKALQRHWKLLTGYYQDGDGKGAIEAIDPAQEHTNYFAPHFMRGMVRQSLDYGIYAYAMSLERPKPAPDA